MCITCTHVRVSLEVCSNGRLSKYDAVCEIMYVSVCEFPSARARRWPLGLWWAPQTECWAGPCDSECEYVQMFERVYLCDCVHLEKLTLQLFVRAMTYSAEWSVRPRSAKSCDSLRIIVLSEVKAPSTTRYSRAADPVLWARPAWVWMWAHASPTISVKYSPSSMLCLTYV